MQLQTVQAWRVESGSLDFRLQIEDITIKSREKVLRDMEGWRIAGEILPASENSNFGLIFARLFKSQEEFSQWYKSFSYPIKIFSSTKDEVIKKRLRVKKEKKEKVKKEKKVKRKKRGKKTCSMCGRLGHNARNCKYKNTKKKLKLCSICCMPGHNSRSCKEK